MQRSRALAGAAGDARHEVVQQIFSPKSKDLFRGAVMFSGCNYTSDNAPLAQAEVTGLDVQKLLGATTLDEMRQVPADQTLAIQNEFQLGRSVAGGRTGGVIDGYFMPASKADILASGGADDRRPGSGDDWRLPHGRSAVLLRHVRRLQPVPADCRR